MALAKLPAVAWSNTRVPLSVTAPNRLAELPCRVAPVSTAKPLVSGPVTISVPAATVVRDTDDVPPRVRVPAFCLMIEPVPAMALLKLPVVA